MSYIYIASPFAIGNTAINIRNAVFAAETLRERGHTPFIPILSHLWQLISPHEAEFWYKYDLELMLLFECILRLPGESKGADAEVQRARALGMPVYYSIDEVPQ